MADRIRIELRQVSDSATEASIREHRALIDRPLAKGGTDTGPMGGELFLASVGGCFMSNLLAAIKAREADVREVQTEVTGTIEANPSRFVAVTLVVSADCEDRDLLGRLVEIASRGCIMVNTLQGILDLQVRVGALP